MHVRIAFSVSTHSLNRSCFIAFSGFGQDAQPHKRLPNGEKADTTNLSHLDQPASLKDRCSGLFTREPKVQSPTNRGLSPLSCRTLHYCTGIPDKCHPE